MRGRVALGRGEMGNNYGWMSARMNIISSRWIEAVSQKPSQRNKKMRRLGKGLGRMKEMLDGIPERQISKLWSGII